MIKTCSLYKPSKFNIVSETDSGDLLIFNSYTGLSSFTKVHKDYKKKMNEILSSNVLSISNFELESSLTQLLIAGVIVPQEDDEMRKIESKYFEVVTGSPSNYLQLIILPTEKCNFKCSYCYESFTKSHLTLEREEAIFNFASRLLKGYAGLSINWFGGEPLIAMDSIERLSIRFIELCKRMKKPYTSVMTTNGYLLDSNKLRDLLKLRVVDFQITLDGLKDTHDRYRRTINNEGTFDRIVANIKDIKINVKSQLFHISIRTNYTRELYESRSECLAFINDLISDDSRFSMYIRSVGDQGGDNGICEIKNDAQLIDGDKMGAIAEMASKVNNVQINAHLTMIQPGGSMCYAGKSNHFVIDSQGILRKCTHFLDNPSFSLGRIEPDGRVKIDKNIESKFISRMILGDKCLKCNLIGVCFNRVCPIGRYADDEMSEAACPFEKDMVNYLLILAEKSNPALFADLYQV